MSHSVFSLLLLVDLKPFNEPGTCNYSVLNEKVFKK